MTLDRINEFNLEPGVYAHHRGDLYVVITILNFIDGQDGMMGELTDPLVIFRDLEPLKGHDSTGRPTNRLHRVYAHPLSEFKKEIDGKPRFKMV